MSQDLHRWKECIPDENVKCREDCKLNPVVLRYSKSCIESWQLDWYQVFSEWYSQSFENTITTNTLFAIAIVILVFLLAPLEHPYKSNDYISSLDIRDGRTRNVVPSGSYTYFCTPGGSCSFWVIPRFFLKIWEIFYQLQFKTVSLLINNVGISS